MVNVFLVDQCFFFFYLDAKFHTFMYPDLNCFIGVETALSLSGVVKKLVLLNCTFVYVC